MQLHHIKQRTNRTLSPRVGRGGRRGKTSGRGGKGQTARAGRKMRPEMRDIIKKIPKRRGYGRNRSRTVRMDREAFFPVNLVVLEASYKAGDTVSPKSLLAKGLIKTNGGKFPKIKILGTGTLTKALVIAEVAMSEAAKKAVLAVGGKAE